MFDEADSYAVQVLENEGVNRLDVVSYLAHGVSRLPPPTSAASSPSALRPATTRTEDGAVPRGGPASDP